MHDLAGRANARCQALHPEPYRTYVIDRNINYTNICSTGCRFCAFAVPEDSPAGYVLAVDILLAKIDELVKAGGTQVLLQGGINGRLELEYYLEMLRNIRSHFPSVQIHAFSPPEIWFMHRHFGLSVDELLVRLVDAGLSSIPGGGAEILVDRVRGLLSPAKCTVAQWLEVMERAHAAGLFTTATMMLGHLETLAERMEHLRLLRQLQDQSLYRGRGCFTAFICWTFQPQRTTLGRQLSNLQETEFPEGLSCSGAVWYLRTLAVARLYLDNFQNLQSSWVTQGPKVGQLALAFGANDMGGLMMEENVVAAAGANYRMSLHQIRHLIRGAGLEPRQRDGFYKLLD